MVDWRQIHNSLEVGTSREKKVVERGWQKIEIKTVLKSRGFGQLKLIVRQSPVTNVTGNILPLPLCGFYIVSERRMVMDNISSL